VSAPLAPTDGLGPWPSFAALVLAALTLMAAAHLFLPAAMPEVDGLSAGVMLLALTALAAPLGRAHVRRVLPTEPLRQGKSAEVTVIVHLPFFPWLVVDVMDGLPLRLGTPERRVFFGRRRICFTYRLGGLPRGLFRFDGVVLGVSDPFGFVTRMVRLPLRGLLEVWPNGTAGEGERLASNVVGVAPQGFDEGLTRSLRPAVGGEDVRSVSWPATARRGELMVRTSDGRRAARWDLSLDLATASGPHFEAVVAAAASIALYARSRRISMRLSTTAGTSDVVSRAHTHVAVMRCLAEAEPVRGVGAGDPAALLRLNGHPIQVTP